MRFKRAHQFSGRSNAAWRGRRLHAAAKHLSALLMLLGSLWLATAQAPPADAGTQGIGGGTREGAFSSRQDTEQVTLAPALAAAPVANTSASGSAEGPSSDGPEYFIRIGRDGNFLNGCETFYPTGWNQFEVVESGAGVPRLLSASLPPGKTGPQLIRDLMAKASKYKFNTIRFFAFGVSPQYALQDNGKFNEGVFRGLDYALDTARRYGIKAILPLVNNWNLTGGADSMLMWNGLEEHELFFSDPATMQTYRNTVKTIITRRNSINGRLYSEDPTILAWNLINEPRCYRCGTTLQTWAAMMAAYVKSLDANHLVGIGEEGFYPQGSPGQVADPLGSQTWAGYEGQDFPKDTAIANIDYGTMHLWVDNWKDESAAFPRTWIQQHIRDAKAAKKPLLLQEFGKFAQSREALFKEVYDMVYESASTGGPLKGASFWQWYDQGQEVQGGGVGDYGMLDSDPVFSLVKDNALKMSQLSRTVSDCQPGDAVSAPPSCEKTWVDGAPGTGYEGPNCDVDINECVRGTDDCAANSGCINTKGSINCTCNYGYAGNGRSSCKETAQLAALQARYVQSAKGTVACRQGADVTYPAGAPGFAYDPTGAFASLGGFGSLLPVTLQGCQQACEAAAAAAPAGRPCDSISYNSVSKACFLKSGGSADDCDAAEVACASVSPADRENAACSDWATYRRATSAAARPAPSATAPSPAAEGTGRATSPSVEGPTLDEQAAAAGAILRNPFASPGPADFGPQLADSAASP